MLKSISIKTIGIKMKRLCLIMLVCIFCMTAIYPGTIVSAQTLVNSGDSLEKWRPYDFEFVSSNVYAEPARVALTATFTGPGGRTLAIPGFYTKNNTWVVRFSPTIEGSWSYSTVSTDSQLNGKSGSITCVANTNLNVHGKLDIDPTYRAHFRYEDGTPYFQYAYEIDWLTCLDFGDPNIPKTKSIIDMISNNGFNEVLMGIYGNDTPWLPGTSSIYDFGPPTQHPYEGTWTLPSYYKPNPVFWENFDNVMDYLFQKGITAHIYIRLTSNKYANYKFPSVMTAEEEFLIRYVSARYQAYPNIIWDYQKEAYVIGTGTTNFDKIKNRLQLLKSIDAYKRIVTLHDGDVYTADPNYNQYMDYYTDQGHDSGVGRYNRIITQRAAKYWPIQNAEYSYQVGNDGGETFGGGKNSPEDVLTKTLEIVMAGGYIGYYYTYHAWDVVRYAETPNKIEYHKYLSNFFRSTKWYSLNPSDSLIGGGAEGKHCLAKPGSEYIVNLKSGINSVTLNVSDVPSGSTLSGKWVNLYTGAEQIVPSVGNGSQTFAKPSSMTSAPAMLYLVGSQGGQQAPVVNAGSDQTINWPTNSTTLSGTVTDDGLPQGATVTQTWTKVSGPGTVTFANASAKSTTATFSAPGIYDLKLTASDTELTGSDIVTITVGNGINLAPVVSAGPDMTVPLTSSVNLVGDVRDDNLPTGAVVTQTWAKVSGPGTVTFANANAASTTATFSAAGTYVLRLTASDTALTGSDDATVTVNSTEPGGNGLSGAYFNNKTLTGAATVTRVDPTVNFSWGTGSPVAGVGTDNFSVRWSGFVKAPVTGTYTFYVNSNDGNKLWVNGTQLTNRWSDGLSEQSGTITLTAGQTYAITLETYEGFNSASCVLSWAYTGQAKQVIPTASLYVGGSVVNYAPVVNAGSDKTITLPTNSVAIDAIVTDDGLPAGATLTYAWTKVSGPGTVTFENPSTIDTTATFSVEGVYVLRLTANDTALVGSDDVTVTVNGSVINNTPVVNVGSDKTITLPPTNSVAIDATVTDDGQPTGATLNYEWTKVSGPGTVTFASPNAVDTTATFSMVGTYVLRLTVSDSLLSGFDEVIVTVLDGSGGNINGLNGAYFNNKTLIGTATVTRVDPTVNFSWGTGSPATGIGTDNFSVRWTGFVKAPVTGTYTFYVNSNDGNKLWVNGTQLTNRWSDGVSEQSGTITLTAGQTYAIILETYEGLNSASCVLSWAYTGQTKQVIPTASLYSE